jgi:hypothetical protein
MEQLAAQVRVLKKQSTESAQEVFRAVAMFLEGTHV